MREPIDNRLGIVYIRIHQQMYTNVYRKEAAMKQGQFDRPEARPAIVSPLDDRGEGRGRGHRGEHRGEHH